MLSSFRGIESFPEGGDIFRVINVFQVLWKIEATF